MHRLIPLILTILLSLCLSCSRDSGRERVLTVTIPPQQWLLQQIAGDDWQVQSLLPPGSNPETFEPSMQQLMELDRSAAFFKAGMPGFEASIVAKVHENLPSLKIIDISDGITPLSGTHASHDGHSATDPHIWTSLRNARVIATNMLAQLKKLDPEGTPHYESNYRKLDDRLRQLDDSIANVLAPRAGTSFIVWHPSLSYFARDYSLRQLIMEHDGKEATPAQLREKLDEACKATPAVFFLQEEYDSRAARTLAAELGIPTASIAVMNPDIAAQARAITSAINAR